MAKEKKEYKYGVADIAKEFGIKETSARVALRDSGFTRAEGEPWGWNSDRDFGEVRKWFKERQTRKPDTTPAEKKPAGKEKDSGAKPAAKSGKGKAAAEQAAKPKRKKAA